MSPEERQQWEDDASTPSAFAERLREDLRIEIGLHEEMTARWRDAEAKLAAKNAEIERLKRGGAELGKIVKRHCDMVLDATGLHDWIDEDGDGDWGAIWENLAELRPRAEAAEAENARLREDLRVEVELHLRCACRLLRTKDEAKNSYARADAAEAKVAKVKALADGLEAEATALMEGEGGCWEYDGCDVCIRTEVVACLRAALADAPAEPRVSGMSDWFRETPETLAMLDEERKALAESEERYAAEQRAEGGAL